MTKRFKLYTLLLLSLFSTTSFAIDPIGWSLDRTFADSIFVNLTTSVTYTFTNQIPAPLVHPLVIEKHHNTAEFSFDDHCTGRLLAPYESCKVTIVLTPTHAGQKEVFLVISGYSKNRVPLPALRAVSINQAIGTFIQTPLPPTALLDALYPYSFVFTNLTSITLTGVSATSSFPGFISTCGPTLAPGQSCTVSGIFAPTTINQQSVTATFMSSQTAPVSVTSSTVITGAAVEATIPVPLPPAMPLNSIHPYTFQFTNTSPITFTGVNATGTFPGFTTTCTSTLAPGQSCTLSGTFISTLSQQSVTATFTSSQTSPVLITTSTITTGEVVNATVLVPLPANTLLNSTQPYSFEFSNPSTLTLTNINATASIPGFTSTCTGTLPPGGSCTVSGTFTPTNINQTSIISATFTSSESIPKVISTSTVITTTQRTVNFINNCSFPVYFSLNGGPRIDPSTSQPYPCQTNSDCPSDSTCNPTIVPGGECFWKNYAPGNNNYQLSASGGSNAVTIPQPQDPNFPTTIFWNGTISASTGCSGSSCITADCGNAGGTTSCNPGTPFTSPATQIQIDMEELSDDTYFIDVSNGFHIPIQLTPQGTGITPNNYVCGSPGAVTPSSPGFGSCNWNNAAPPSSDPSYYWVTSGGTNCASTADCTGGQICGVSLFPNAQVCGDFLGYWSGKIVCELGLLFPGTFFNCNAALPTPPYSSGTTLTNLYTCSPATSLEFGSCTVSGATAACCGCVDWSTQGITLPTPSASCVNTSTEWVNNILPTLDWMKTTCPNYLVYPQDEPSSLFSCKDTNQINVLNYTVTFCANNISGLPAGATEGRNG